MGVQRPLEWVSTCLQWGPLNRPPQEAKVSSSYLLARGVPCCGWPFREGGACIVPWFILNANGAGSLWFTACSLCVTWGLSGRGAWSMPLAQWLSYKSHSRAEGEKEPQEGYRGQEWEPLCFLGQQESGFME